MNLDQAISKSFEQALAENGLGQGGSFLPNIAGEVIRRQAEIMREMGFDPNTGKKFGKYATAQDLQNERKNHE